MGNILKISCKCGFKERLLVGGGMQTFESFCGAPAMCPACQKWSPANYYASPAEQTCKDCGGPLVFYNDPSLQANPKAKGTIFSWGTTADKTFTLPATKFNCPQCGNLTLKMKDVGSGIRIPLIG